jgi:hypothetical protein
VRAGHAGSGALGRVDGAGHACVDTGVQERTLDCAPRSRRRSAFHPRHCRPVRHTVTTAGDVDVDAGQGSMLQGSNHLTSGCLTVSSKHDDTRIQSTITQKPTVTYITKSDCYHRQAPARQPHVLAWRALAVIPREPLANSRFRPLASYGPGSFTLRTQSVTEVDSTRYGQWLQPHGPLIYAGFSARASPRLAQEGGGFLIAGCDDPTPPGKDWRSQVSRSEQ